MAYGVGIITGQAIPALTGVTLLARIVGQLNSPITIASLTSISYQVSDLTAGLVSGTGTFVVATAVFNNLQQQDNRWTKDGPSNLGPDSQWGYNFLGTLAAALFPASTLVPAQPSPFEVLSAQQSTFPWTQFTPVAGQPPPHRFQCDVAFTPVSGQPFRTTFQWSSLSVFA